MNVDEYRKLAEVEDRMWYFRALHAHVERALASGLGARGAAILDAGCGTGGLIRRLGGRHATWSWTGIDVSPVACAIARQRLTQPAGSISAAAPRSADDVSPPVNVIEGSVVNLPFGDGTYDAIVSADVLYHVDDDRAALAEFHRVLRPGGTLVLNVPAYQWLWSYHDVAVHSRRRYSRPDVLERLATAGFATSRATYWNAIPFPLVVTRRKLLPAPKEGSDVHLFPPPVEAAFNSAMAVERVWLGAFGRLPFGSSVFAVARKPGAPTAPVR